MGAGCEEWYAECECGDDDPREKKGENIIPRRPATHDVDVFFSSSPLFVEDGEDEGGGGGGGGCFDIISSKNPECTTIPPPPSGPNP